MMKNQDWVETSDLFNNNIVWQVNVWLVEFPHARAVCAVKSVVLRDPNDIFVLHISYIGHGIHMLSYIMYTNVSCRP